MIKGCKNLLEVKPYRLSLLCCRNKHIDFAFIESAKEYVKTKKG